MANRSRKAARSTTTVLVVDRDHALRATIRRWLESDGYRVLDAGDLVAAEQIAKLYVGPIHLLLIEVSGGTLADRLRSLRPEPSVLFMSDRARSELVGEGELAARARFIGKPFERAELALEVRRALGAAS